LDVERERKREREKERERESFFEAQFSSCDVISVMFVIARYEVDR